VNGRNVVDVQLVHSHQRLVGQLVGLLQLGVFASIETEYHLIEHCVQLKLHEQHGLLQLFRERLHAVELHIGLGGALALQEQGDGSTVVVIRQKLLHLYVCGALWEIMC